MPVTAVIGAQWGDEGKGKIVDYLAQKADFVIRFNGGPNAGHTVKNQYGEFKLHLVPCGIFNSETTCIIGNGVVVNPEILVREMDVLREKGISCQNLRISPRANLIMPWHLLLDGAEEEFRGAEGIGTTRQGIGPAFADKVARKGIRAEDLLRLRDPKFPKRFRLIWQEKNEILWKIYQKWGLGTFEQIYNWLLYYSTLLSPHVIDTEYLIQKALDENKNILLEGAQATLLDIDFGTYPDVTSSACTAAGACQGSGIPPTKINEIIGVVKAFPTRVGSKDQPFPTEMPEEVANPLRERAHEYGATTGRPRRIGWFDALLAKYSARINGFTSLAITRLDNLTGFKRLKVCYCYQASNGKVISTSLMKGLSLVNLKEVQPFYFELSGWKKFPKKCKKFSDLPPEAQLFLEAIETHIGVPIKYISVGPERDQMIVKE